MPQAIGAILIIVGIVLAVWDANNGFVILWRRVALLAAILIGIGFLVTPAHSQEHRGHPPQDQAIHEKFYSTWMRPDAPQISCCNEKDCYPTEARKTPSGWIAKRREDGQWLSVPDARIERERDNPDGRNHLCAPPPIAGDTVYCFAIGGGT